MAPRTYQMILSAEDDPTELAHLECLVRDLQSIRNAPRVFRVDTHSVMLYGLIGNYQSVQYRMTQERGIPNQLRRSWAELAGKIQDTEDQTIKLEIAKDFLMLGEVLRQVNWGKNVVDAMTDLDAEFRQSNREHLLIALAEHVSAGTHGPQCGGPFGTLIDLPPVPSDIAPPAGLLSADILAQHAAQEQVSPASIQLDL